MRLNAYRANYVGEAIEVAGGHLTFQETRFYLKTIPRAAGITNDVGEDRDAHWKRNPEREQPDECQFSSDQTVRPNY